MGRQGDEDGGWDREAGYEGLLEKAKWGLERR